MQAGLSLHHNFGKPPVVVAIHGLSHCHRSSTTARPKASLSEGMQCVEIEGGEIGSDGLLGNSSEK